MRNEGAQQLVLDDVDQGIFRVHRRAFTDPEIFALERQLIFEKSWVYVGHESEIPQPGSFVRRTVIGKPCIMLRDDAGAVQVLFNSCPHRGNMVCRDAAGQAKRFQCFYHGWTFDTRGRLIAVPDQAGYSPAFDMTAYSLAKPARVDTYRGLVFMSLNADVVDLSTYLGKLKEYLDLLLDQSDHIEVSPGPQRYEMKANWKLYVENSLDGYHALITHHRYFVSFLKDMGQDPKSWSSMTEPHPENVVFDLGNGHAAFEFPLGNNPLAAKAGSYIQRERERLEQKYGAERTHRMLDFNRNLFVFPNLLVIAHWRALRTFNPISPHQVHVDSYALGNKDEPPELRRLRLDNFLSFQGPAGFATPDDLEALEGCQRGFAAPEPEWSDISRGMLRKAITTDELQMRVFWRRWYQHLDTSFVPGVEKGASQSRARETAS